MTASRYVSAFLALRHDIEYVYGAERVAAIGARTTFVDADPYFDIERLMLGGTDTTNVDVLFSTWGMTPLNGQQVDRYFPNLKAVFYAAGGVAHFAQPYYERNIRIISAYKANAIPVAEFSVAQIILGLKGYYRNEREYDGTKPGFDAALRGPGSYGETVGLLGAGAIGRHVIRLLKPYELNVLVWDPFLSYAEADKLGVEKVESLQPLFEKSFVVSNHLADKPETQKTISRQLMLLLRENAVLINTGRGPTIDEEALIDVFSARQDLTALLDVTHPEPPGAESCLIKLPNVRLTSHIAGSIGGEVRRMADLVIGEFDRYVAGQPLQYELTKELFALM